MKYFLLFLMFCGVVQAQNCPEINNRIVVNGSEIFVVKQCVLRPIDDIAVYNSFLLTIQTDPIQISNKVFSQLSIGKPYTDSDFMNEFGTGPSVNVADLCQKYENQIVSTDNITFYYIDKCQKRKFLNSIDVQRFSNKSSTGSIGSIANFELSKIKSGPDMQVQKLSFEFSPTDLEIARTLPPLKETCAQVKKNALSQIVSYYTSIFYFESCVLHPIDHLTIDTMQDATAAGGIYNLTTQEFLVLPQGTPWNKKI